MNCKPGDLVVMVRSEAGNEGKIFTCLRFVGAVPGWPQSDFWEIDMLLSDAIGTKKPYAPDSFLRPLRYGDGEDEMLRIAGRPQDIKQPA